MRQPNWSKGKLFDVIIVKPLELFDSRRQSKTGGQCHFVWPFGADPPCFFVGETTRHLKLCTIKAGAVGYVIFCGIPDYMQFALTSEVLLPSIQGF